MIFVTFDPTLRYVFISDSFVKYKVYICNKLKFQKFGVNMIILQTFILCVCVSYFPYIIFFGNKMYKFVISLTFLAIRVYIS